MPSPRNKLYKIALPSTRCSQHSTMASIIPPKRPVRAGMPKLVMPTSVTPDASEDTSRIDSTTGETDATIMPRAIPSQLGLGLETQMDELKRMLDDMKTPASVSYEYGGVDMQVQASGDSGMTSSSNSSSWHMPQDPSSVSFMRSNSSLELESSIPPASEHANDIEVLASLGEGASGEVKKARIKSTGKIIAQKVIPTSPDPMIHRQLLRELNVNKSCKSEYIVNYYGAFFEPETASITICMEFCEAGSMDSIYRRVKARGGRVGEKVLAKLAESIIKGLEYLHQCRIIHRDVKPSNILVRRDGQMKLCDFGVSGELIDSVAGTFTGTATYMAPERIMGHSYTITSDVWSVGVTILELALNRYPFSEDGETPMGPIDLLSYLLGSPLPTLESNDQIRWSRSLRDFVDRCLERDGTKRDSPRVLLQHPLVRRAEMIPNSDMARFVASVWNWTS